MTIFGTIDLWVTDGEDFKRGKKGEIHAIFSPMEFQNKMPGDYEICLALPD